MRILYGGSVKEDNAADYLALDGVDGFLIGGASLDAHAFNEIIKKAPCFSFIHLVPNLS